MDNLLAVSSVARPAQRAAPSRLWRSGITQSDVDDSALAPCVHREAASLKDLERRKVAREDLRHQFAQACLTRDRHEVSQQRGADPLALIFVDKPEGDLGLAWFDDVIAAAADQGRAPVFVRDRNQRDMLDEVYVEKIVGLFLGNLAFGRKEAKIARFRTCPRERRSPTIEVLRTLGANRDRAPVTQSLGH